MTLSSNFTKRNDLKIQFGWTYDSYLDLKYIFVILVSNVDIDIATIRVLDREKSTKVKMSCQVQWPNQDICMSFGNETEVFSGDLMSLYECI